MPLVFVDQGKYDEGVRTEEWKEAPISEDYILEPVNSGGVFHPKVNLFVSSRSVYFSVSSANLSLEEYCKAAQIGFADGFQKSWVTDDDHEVGEEYFVATDVVEFFEDLVEANGLVTGQDALNYMRETVETVEWLPDLRDEVPIPEEERSVMLFSSLSEPVLTQVVDYLPQVERVRLYAPFYGSPSVLSDIAEELDVGRIELIVEPSSTALEVDGLEEALEGFDVSLRVMEVEGRERWVHGKFMLLEGEWGEACLYGSPNMTGSALLSNARNGNVEVGLLTMSHGSKDVTEAVFHDQSFEFGLSDPLEDWRDVEVRSESYEDWESVGGGGPEFRLSDARLTQPGGDDTAELILRIEGLSGEHEFEVENDEGESKTVKQDLDEGAEEVSVILSKGEFSLWNGSVVHVRVSERDVESNPRRIMVETQAYYREFRKITDSDGTRSSNTLLREILENPDNTVMSVFDLAISELRSTSGVEEPGRPDASREDDVDSFPERGPSRLTSEGRSVPSLHSLVELHLDYHLNQMLDALVFEDRPMPENVDRCLDHFRTFWETIELCYYLELTGRLDDSNINTDKLFEKCEDGVSDWLGERSTFVTRVNGLVNQIEKDPEIEDEFVGDDEDVESLDIWKSMFEAVVLHPGVLLDMEDRLDYSVFTSKNTLGDRILWLLDDIHPYVWRHMFQGKSLRLSSETLVSDLVTTFEVNGSEAEIGTDGVKALVFYMFLQKVAHSEGFIDGLRSSETFTNQNLTEFARFALEGQAEAVDMGLMNEMGQTIVLADEIEEMENLAHS